ncbi:lipoate--protein ligase family protein [bacterium]|nr:lipoate--protein ligase family protein [bacterium]
MFQVIWHYIDSGAHPGKWNMFRDQKLAEELGAGLRPPTLRFFQWQPYCISLGKHQKIDDIDIEKCKSKNIDVVYRPTGGRAILHAEELTYSVIFSDRNTGGIEETYRQISEALVAGLKEVGIPAAMVMTQPDFKSLYRQTQSMSCFSSSARYEIQVDGHKLVGSAQRRLAGAVLQHGSILTGPYHRKLTDFLRLNDQDRQLAESIMNEKTIELSQIKNVDLAELKRAIRAAFQKLFHIEFIEEKFDDLVEV